MDKTLEEQGNLYLTQLYNTRVKYAVSMGGTTESKDYAGLGVNLDPLASQMAQLIIDQQVRIKELESQLTQVTEAEVEAAARAIFDRCVDSGPPGIRMKPIWDESEQIRKVFRLQAKSALEAAAEVRNGYE